MLFTASNVFICSLAFSESTAGLLAQSFFVIDKIGEISRRFDMHYTTRILLESGLENVAARASVLTMTGMAVERCLYRPYRQGVYRSSSVRGKTMDAVQPPTFRGWLRCVDVFVEAENARVKPRGLWNI